MNRTKQAHGATGTSENIESAQRISKVSRLGLRGGDRGKPAGPADSHLAPEMLG